MLCYTYAFCLTYGMGRVYEKTGNTFSTQITRGKIVPVVELRHAKFVVVDGIYGRNQWHAVVPVSHRVVVIFPENTLWSSIGGVEGVICCCCGACLRCCGRLPVNWKRSCWYVKLTNNIVLLPT